MTVLRLALIGIFAAPAIASTRSFALTKFYSNDACTQARPAADKSLAGLDEESRIAPLGSGATCPTSAEPCQAWGIGTYWGKQAAGCEEEATYTAGFDYTATYTLTAYSDNECKNVVSSTASDPNPYTITSCTPEQGSDPDDYYSIRCNKDVSEVIS